MRIRVALLSTLVWLTFFATILAACNSGESSGGSGTPSPKTAATATASSSTSSIQIDITSGDTQTTVRPGETAGVPLNGGNLRVVIHLRQSITETERQAVQVETDSTRWQAEVVEAPSDDAIAFVLRGASPGSFNVAVKGAGGVPIRFAVRVASPSA
jgi:hypothetical protein